MPSDLSFAHTDSKTSASRCVRFTSSLPFNYAKEIDHLSDCRLCNPNRTSETMTIHIYYGWLGSRND